jgi:hypothetical protein
VVVAGLEQRVAVEVAVEVACRILSGVRSVKETALGTSCSSHWAEGGGNKLTLLQGKNTETLAGHGGQI